VPKPEMPGDPGIMQKEYIEYVAKIGEIDLFNDTDIDRPPPNMSFYEEYVRNLLTSSDSMSIRFAPDYVKIAKGFSDEVSASFVDKLEAFGDANSGTHERTVAFEGMGVTTHLNIKLLNAYHKVLTNNLVDDITRDLAKKTMAGAIIEQLINSTAFDLDPELLGGTMFWRWIEGGDLPIDFVFLHDMDGNMDIDTGTVTDAGIVVEFVDDQEENQCRLDEALFEYLDYCSENPLFNVLYTHVWIIGFNPENAASWAIEEGSSVHVLQLGSLVEQQIWQLIGSFMLEDEFGSDMGITPTYPKATSTDEILNFIDDTHASSVIINSYQTSRHLRNQFRRMFLTETSGIASYADGLSNFKRQAGKVGRKLLTEWVEMPIYYQLHGNHDAFIYPLSRIFNCDLRNNPDLTYMDGREEKTLTGADFGKMLKLPLYLALIISGFSLQETAEHPMNPGQTYTYLTSQSSNLNPSNEITSFVVVYPALWGINDPRNFLKIWNDPDKIRKIQEAEASDSHGKGKVIGSLVTLWSYLGLFVPADVFSASSGATAERSFTDFWDDTSQSQVSEWADLKQNLHIPTFYKYGTTHKTITYRSGGAPTCNAIDLVLAQNAGEMNFFTRVFSSMKAGEAGFKDLRHTENLNYQLLGCAIKVRSGYPGSTYGGVERTSNDPINGVLDRDWFTNTLPSLRRTAKLTEMYHESLRPPAGGNTYTQHIVSTKAEDSWKGRLNLAVHENLLDIFNQLIPYTFKRQIAVRQNIMMLYGTIPLSKSQMLDNINTIYSGTVNQRSTYEGLTKAQAIREINSIWYDSPYRWTAYGRTSEGNIFFEPYGFVAKPGTQCPAGRSIAAVRGGGTITDALYQEDTDSHVSFFKYSQGKPLPPWIAYPAYRPVYQICIADGTHSRIHNDKSKNDDYYYANDKVFASDQNMYYPGLTISHGESQRGGRILKGYEYLPGGAAYTTTGSSGFPSASLDDWKRLQDVYVYEPSGSYKDFGWTGPLNWEMFAKFFAVGIVPWFDFTDDSALNGETTGYMDATWSDWDSEGLPLTINRQEWLSGLCEEDPSTGQAKIDKLAEHLSVKVGIAGLTNFIDQFKTKTKILNGMLMEIKRHQSWAASDWRDSTSSPHYEEIVSDIQNGKQLLCEDIMDIFITPIDEITRDKKRITSSGGIDLDVEEISKFAYDNIGKVLWTIISYLLEIVPILIWIFFVFVDIIENAFDILGALINPLTIYADYQSADSNEWNTANWTTADSFVVPGFLWMFFSEDLEVWIFKDLLKWIRRAIIPIIIAYCYLESGHSTLMLPSLKDDLMMEGYHLWFYPSGVRSIHRDAGIYRYEIVRINSTLDQQSSSGEGSGEDLATDALYNHATNLVGNDTQSLDEWDDAIKNHPEYLEDYKHFLASYLVIRADEPGMIFLSKCVREGNGPEYPEIGGYQFLDPKDVYIYNDPNYPTVDGMDKKESFKTALFLQDRLSKSGISSTIVGARTLSQYIMQEKSGILINTMGALPLDILGGNDGVTNRIDSQLEVWLEGGGTLVNYGPDPMQYYGVFNHTDPIHCPNLAQNLLDFNPYLEINGLSSQRMTSYGTKYLTEMHFHQYDEGYAIDTQKLRELKLYYEAYTLDENNQAENIVFQASQDAVGFVVNLYTRGDFEEDWEDSYVVQLLVNYLGAAPVAMNQREAKQQYNPQTKSWETYYAETPVLTPAEMQDDTSNMWFEPVNGTIRVANETIPLSYYNFWNVSLYRPYTYLDNFTLNSEFYNDYEDENQVYPVDLLWGYDFDSGTYSGWDIDGGHCLQLNYTQLDGEEQVSFNEEGDTALGFKAPCNYISKIDVRIGRQKWADDVNWRLAVLLLPVAVSYARQRYFGTRSQLMHMLQKMIPIIFPYGQTMVLKAGVMEFGTEKILRQTTSTGS